MLTRYLDFLDSFFAPGETPSPSDNIGAVVAAGETFNVSREELLEGSIASGTEDRECDQMLKKTLITAISREHDIQFHKNRGCELCKAKLCSLVQLENKQK